MTYSKDDALEELILETGPGDHDVEQQPRRQVDQRQHPAARDEGRIWESRAKATVVEGLDKRVRRD
jgi:hypothetical protein